MTNQSRKCSNCMWWDAVAINHGACKGGPPQVDPNSRRSILWPMTSDRDWCGSFRMKEPEE